MKIGFYRDRWHRTGYKNQCIECALKYQNGRYTPTPKMKYIMFKPEFAPLVRAGTKKQTIRPPRERAFAIGDYVSLRKWLGKPYRSKQEELCEGTVTNVRPIAISLRADEKGHRVWLAGAGYLKGRELNALAKADGFKTYPEFIEFFKSVHGLPFRGVVINWS